MAIFVGLGSNLENPRKQILESLDRLSAVRGIEIARRSSLYRAEPWGLRDQPAFCNAVAQLETDFEPRVLLDKLLGIERAMGRKPLMVRWGPRRIDLDLLIYHGRRIIEPGLVIPHPHIRERAFVLTPLLEIAPCVGEPGTARPYAPSLPRLLKQGEGLRLIERH